MRSVPLAVASAIVLAVAGSQARAEPKAQIQGNMDRDLRLAIARAVGESGAPAESGFEARRRAREAAADARAVLRSEGYYLARIEAQTSAGDRPRAILQIDPGQRFVFVAPRLAWSGPSPEPMAGMAAEKALGLAPDAPGRAADVIAAEGRAIAALTALGYADATVQPREVIVDDADHTVRPTFRIAAGGKVHLDGVRLVTRGRTRGAWLAGLAPWRGGETYAPEKVARLERRLLETEAFDQVTVALAPPSEDQSGRRPVIVSLADRPRSTVELGATYASAESSGAQEVGPTSQAVVGSGVEGRWFRYDRLGLADTQTLTAELHDIQQKLDFEVDLPDWRRADQILKTGVGVSADRTSAFDDTDAGVRADVERHFTKTTFIPVGGAFDFTQTKEKTAVNLEATPVGERLSLFLVTGLAGFNLDRSNSPLDPTRGWRLDVHLEPTAVTGDRSLAYLKAVGQASAYLPLDARAATVVAARLRLGTILGGGFPDVPADRRFFAGGGGSVRGYAYQAVGPRLADNTPAGGMSLVESSVEIRRRVTERWGFVAFVDAGQVGESAAPVFSPMSVGAGLGVRYDLGFAPFRVDVATPLNPRKGDAAVEVYVSIGQSF